MSKKVIGILLLLAISTVSIFCWDIAARFHLGNLSFADDRVSSADTFDGAQYPWGVTVAATQQVSDNIALNLGYYYNPVLKNSARTFFTYAEDYFEIGVGPFFGVFNTAETILKPGISTSIKLDLPGIAYVYFRTDSSINGRISQPGDYYQESSIIKLGYYVPNAICTAYMQSDTYAYMTPSSNEVADKLIEYGFSVNIFKKNVPYRLDLGISYQDLSKNFLISGSDPVVHSLSSVIVDTVVTIDLTDSISCLIDMETSMYTFGREALTGIANPGPNGFLFRGTAGVAIRL